MKTQRSLQSGLVALATLTTLALGAVQSRAQTVANGPYYVSPAWDQTLPSNTRFVVLTNMDNNAVLDRETGLVWERSPLTQARVWFNAQDRCNGLILGKRHGWRLPLIQELASLIDGDLNNFQAPRLPPGHPFLNVQDGFYWSATIDPDTLANPIATAWVVYHGYANVGDPRVLRAFRSSGASALYVWCVRGGQGAPVQ